MDANQAPMEPANRPDRPSRPVGLPSKLTHKVAHFRIYAEENSMISDGYKQTQTT
jgi:hypothetical protein